jgi:hypothetical protein
MMPCPYCVAYASDPPGLVPAIVDRTPEELALPPERRGPAQVIWVPCNYCQGGVASCCDGVGNDEGGAIADPQ